MNRDIKSMDLAQLTQTLAELGEPKFRAKQIYTWLHRGARTFDEMTNLSKPLRQRLSETFDLTPPEVVRKQVSRADGTVKYLWRLSDGNCVETVLMQYHHGNTVCISSEVGCAMGCAFCASTLGGLVRRLTPAEMLESAEKKIYALRKGERGDSLEPISLTLHKVFDHLNELSQSESAIPGLSTGLQDLDRKINGLNKSDLLLVAARPAMGKSAFALNLALNVAKKYGKTVAIFNLEMSREQLAMRLLAIESFVDGQKMATGKLSDEEWTKLCMASASLSQTDIRIDDNPTITVAEMNAKCRRLDNLGMVVIDYLQLMSGSGYGKGGDSRVNIVSEISRSLKIMAKELNVPVVCLSQLSRATESRTDKRPMLSDLRESGAIEQDADEVLFLYRDEYYNEHSEDKGIAECIVSKNRHGEIGTVKLQWIPQFQTFADREWKHAE